MKKNLTLLLFVLCGYIAQAQEKWDLRKLVEYAMQNNISVKRQDIQARLSELTYEQSRLSQLPTANIQNSGGYQFGRTIDPTSNQFTTREILFVNHSLNLGVDIFNWFSKKNTVAANRFDAQAAKADVDKLKNDIALNVANGYLQVLLNGEQVKISEVQVQQSLEQVSITGKQVNAGALPELNLLELQTQLANDSTTLLTAQANYKLSILQLKALLNIPADAPFIIETPNVDQIPVESLVELDPQSVYQLAVKNLPQQRANEFRLLAAQRNVEAVRGTLYPTLSAFGSLDSRYSNFEKQYIKSVGSRIDSIGYVDLPGGQTKVNVRNVFPTAFGRNDYFRQISNNFGQSIGIGLRIPIFNGGTARTNLKRAQLNVKDVELQKELASQTIKQDIYQAHASALAALQKYNSNTKSVATAEKAYDYAKKRYDIGLLNTIDLITNQNNLFRAKINLVSAQYDYVFKMKVLEFYKGQGIKL